MRLNKKKILYGIILCRLILISLGLIGIIGIIIHSACNAQVQEQDTLFSSRLCRRMKGPNPALQEQAGRGRGFYQFAIPSVIYHGTHIRSVVTCLEGRGYLEPLGNFVYFTPSDQRAMVEAKEAYGESGLGEKAFIALEFDTEKLGNAEIPLVRWMPIEKSTEMYTARDSVPLSALTDACKKDLLLRLYGLKKMDGISGYPETPEEKKHVARVLGFDNWAELKRKLEISLP